MNYLNITFLEPNLMSPISPNEDGSVGWHFSKPEMSLMAAVMEYFSLEYQPEILYYDVSNSIGAAHATFHLETSLYLDRDPFMIPWLEKLIPANKKVFLIC